MEQSRVLIGVEEIDDRTAQRRTRKSQTDDATTVAHPVSERLDATGLPNFDSAVALFSRCHPFVVTH